MIPAFVLPFLWVSWAVGIFVISALPFLPVVLAAKSHMTVSFLAVMLASFLVSVPTEYWFGKGKKLPAPSPSAFLFLLTHAMMMPIRISRRCYYFFDGEQYGLHVNV